MSSRPRAIPAIILAFLISPWAGAVGAGLAITEPHAVGRLAFGLPGYNPIADQTVPTPPIRPNAPPLPGSPALPGNDAPPAPIAPSAPVPLSPPPNAGLTPEARTLIADLQRALPAHGYHAGPQTGRLDPATERAILNYQRDAGLAPDTHDAEALKATLDSLYNHRPPIMSREQRG